MPTPKKSHFDSKVRRPDVDPLRVGVNPLSISGFSIPVSCVPVEGRYSMDKDGVWLPAEVELERDEKAALYIGSSRRLAWMGMGNAPMRLMLWMVFELDTGRDYVWVNVRRYLSESGVSLNTYKSGVEDLCRYGFIHPMIGYKDVYWVNPAYCFRGSRTRAYPGRVERR